MYERYFGLREPPFNLTPNPRCFFANASYKDALSTLSYGIQRRAGMIVVTGDAGTGKTTLLKRFLSSAARNIRCSCILDPRLEFNDLLRCTLDVFGVSEPAQDSPAMLRRLHGYLIERLKQHHLVALLLDEAQSLDDKVLEELIILSDLAEGDKKLLQIVLLGQPELESRLEQSRHAPLRERVTVRTRLNRLGENDIKPYIEYRLAAAGYSGKTIFAAQAIARIGFFSQGVPRLVNVICDNALLVSYAKSQRVVSGETIEEVAEELNLGGVYRAESQPVAPKTLELKIGEAAGGYAIAGKKPEAQLEDLRAHKAGQIAESRKRLWVDKRYEITRAALAVVVVALMAVLGRVTLSSPPQEPEANPPPVTDNVQKLKKLFAPFPGRIYRAVIVLTERPQDSKTFERAKEGSGQQTKSAGGGVTIGTEQKPKDGGGAAVAKMVRQPKRKNQSVENGKPPASQAEFKVVRDSLVRDKPSSSAAIIATLRPGTEVRLVRRMGDYLQVRSVEKGAVHGFVHVEDAFFGKFDQQRRARGNS